uniref:Fatty acid 2-hydroxylase n=1 Tax=Sinocyclocheilus anshuiensis TaxID=1608454 RepID=A0A671N9Z7_9TELE
MNNKMSPSVSPRFFSEKEVSKHCTKDSCWVLLGTRVYDVTGFLRMHPGGEALILRRSGKDVSREIEGPPHRHSENARRWMEQYYIGELDRDSIDEDTEETVSDCRFTPWEHKAFGSQRYDCTRCLEVLTDGL